MKCGAGRTTTQTSGGEGRNSAKDSKDMLHTLCVFASWSSYPGRARARCKIAQRFGCEKRNMLPDVDCSVVGDVPMVGWMMMKMMIGTMRCNGRIWTTSAYF